MSIDRKRWAQAAEELKFHQVTTARKQAEGWRSGLAGVTALLTAILVVKGRDTVADLTPEGRWSAVLLLGVGLALLVSATLFTIRAASGALGVEIPLTAEDLRAWSTLEVNEVGRLLRLATVFTVTAVAFLALAIGVTWLSPSGKGNAPTFELITRDGRSCSELLSMTNKTLVVKTKDILVVPLDQVVSIRPGCTPDKAKAS